MTTELCLGCQRLEAGESLVTLIDGRVVCTWCDAWRLECLQRHKDVQRILGYGSREVRRRALEDVERRDGPLARERLEAAVRAAWAKRLEAAAS